MKSVEVFNEDELVHCWAQTTTEIHRSKVIIGRIEAVQARLYKNHFTINGGNDHADIQ